MTQPINEPARTPHDAMPRALRGAMVGSLFIVTALLGGLTGCRGDRSDKPPRQFLPDMDDQPRWNPQSKTEFFAGDHRTMRQPEAGTIPFGRSARTGDESNATWTRAIVQRRADLLAEDSRVYEGLEPGVELATAWEGQFPERFVRRIPIPVDRALLERGRERFDIYCSACHGYSGEGGAQSDTGGYGGMAARRWSYPVPNYHDAKYKDPGLKTGRDGYLYFTAMNGVEMGGKMPGYRHALSSNDAWAIVAYIRALQRSREATLDEVPVDQRQALQAQLQMPGPGGGDQ